MLLAFIQAKSFERNIISCSYVNFVVERGVAWLIDFSSLRMKTISEMIDTNLNQLMS